MRFSLTNSNKFRLLHSVIIGMCKIWCAAACENQKPLQRSQLSTGSKSNTDTVDWDVNLNFIHPAILLSLSSYYVLFLLKDALTHARNH